MAGFEISEKGTGIAILNENMCSDVRKVYRVGKVDERCVDSWEFWEGANLLRSQMLAISPVNP